MEAIFSSITDLAKFYVVKQVNTGDRLYDDAIRVFIMAVIAFVLVYIRMVPTFLFDLIQKGYRYLTGTSSDTGHLLTKKEILRCVRTGMDWTKMVAIGFAADDTIKKICAFIEKQYPYPELYDIETRALQEKISSLESLKMDTVSNAHFSQNGQFHFFPVYRYNDEYVFVNTWEHPEDKAVVKFQLLSPRKYLLSKFASEMGIVEEEKEKKKMTMVYSSSLSTFMLCRSKDLRHMFFAEKAQIQTLLTKFQRDELGGLVRSNNLSLLMYGCPGTGKTLLAKCIASELHRKLSIYSAATIRTYKDLFEILSNTKDVLLFDEFDLFLDQCLTSSDKCTQDMERYQKMLASLGPSDVDAKKVLIQQINQLMADQKNGITYEAFLTLLDGAMEPDGRVLLATTNHIESIHPTLIRPGRFRKILMDKMTSRDLRLLLEDTYREPVTVELPDKRWTPAEVAELMDSMPLSEALKKLQ